MMRTADYVRFAFRPFRTRPLETLLIVSAVAIGASVVATMLALLTLSFREQARLMNAFYTREIMVAKSFLLSAERPVVEVGRVGEPPVEFRLGDMEDARRSAPAVQYAYLRQPGGLILPLGCGEADILEVTEDYPAASGLALKAGAWFSRAEVARGDLVIVLNEWCARKRFGDGNPIGQMIGPFRVIGVFTPSDRSDMAGEPRNGRPGLGGLVPWGTAQSGDPFAIYFIPRPGQDREARSLLAAFANARWGGAVRVASGAERFAEFNRGARAVAIVVALFASGGLLIASVNIMNLMLARVLGRTREIGTSRALGASQGIVFRIFLTESLALGLVGTAIGLSVSTAIVRVLNALFIVGGRDAARRLVGIGVESVHLSLGPVPIAASVALAIVVTMVFGAYPAILAARTHASEALRA